MCAYMYVVPNEGLVVTVKVRKVGVVAHDVSHVCARAGSRGSKV